MTVQNAVAKGRSYLKSLRSFAQGQAFWAGEGLYHHWVD